MSLFNRLAFGSATTPPHSGRLNLLLVSKDTSSSNSNELWIKTSSPTGGTWWFLNKSPRWDLCHTELAYHENTIVSDQSESHVTISQSGTTNAVTWEPGTANGDFFYEKKMGATVAVRECQLEWTVDVTGTSCDVFLLRCNSAGTVCEPRVFEFSSGRGVSAVADS